MAESGGATIRTLEQFFGWTDAGLGRKRIRCRACGTPFELRLMDDLLEATCPSCGRGPFFERAREIEAQSGPDAIARILVGLGILSEEEVASAAEARDPSAPASPSDETAGLVGAARALGFFSKSLYLTVELGDGALREPVFRARPMRELVDEKELREAVEIERSEGTPIGEVVAAFALNAQKETLLSALGDAPGVDLDAIEPPRAAIELIPPGVAASYLAIPIALEPAGPGEPPSAARAVIAVRDPLDFDLVEQLKLITGRDVRTVAASEDALFRALERFYPEGGEPSGPRREELEAIEAAGAAAHEAEPEALPAEHIAEEGEEDEEAFEETVDLPDEPPGVRTLNLLLLQAADERAELVVIEPLDDNFRVRLRRGGRLRDAGRLPQAAGEAAIERAMVLAGMDLSRRNRAQTGTMRLTIAGETLEIEAASAPAALGPTIALAIREAAFRLLPIDALGLVPGDGRELRSLLALPRGLTVVAAPPGEGRTTLLYALLREADRRRAHVVSLERTIRARVEGATQIAVADYASVATSVDRLRPDWVFIDDLLGGAGALGRPDEVRVALDLAFGGTRVIAAIEAPDPVAALARAAATGVDACVLLSPLRALVGLRLVKRVCPRCREDFEASADLAGELGLTGIGAEPAWPGGPPAPERRRLSIGIGCWECGGTGYRGRSALVEVVPVDAELRERARSLDIRSVRALAAERGVRPLPEKALLALRAGLTSVSQVEAILRER